MKLQVNLLGWSGVALGVGILGAGAGLAQPSTAPLPETRIPCEIFIAGGGLGGVAAAYDALQLGRQVCMTEITDWIGGQVSAQGVSALDERPLQRENDIFPKGYSEFRRRVREKYGGDPNPGKCWVSVLCFSPQVGHQVIREMLDPYLQSGQLRLFTETVVKDLEIKDSQIRSVQAIRNIPKHAGVEPEQRGDLSTYLLDFYRLEPTDDWDKEILRFEPPPERQGKTLPWVVIDATETGELLPLARVPYRLGTDGQSRWEPSSKPYVDPYCTQGFTYTFVLERSAVPQVPIKPEFYNDPLHGPYYSFEQPRFNFGLVFTYRRIRGQVFGFGEEAIRVGDQSMQNWTWGNDWRITGPDKNFILTHEQLQASGQLDPGGWMGGLRVEALRRAEQHAKGFFYWLVAGRTDFLLQQEDPNFQKDFYLRYAYLRGPNTPMGTASGLSKYPYIRESRRIIGRPSLSYPEGFTIYESDITTRESELNRGRPFIFYDSVGVGQYPIDFHDCLLPGFSLPPSNNKDAQAPSYPYQIPLRALIPQRIDNLLAGNKNIATSRIASASYRVHPVEWAIGTAAGHTAHFALERDLIPAEIVEEPLLDLRLLPALQAQIQSLGNPIQFPGTTITATDWAQSR
ncbi:FAD-dependent oxidoreductase [Synechococcus sp. W55.1]|uniref:FAD-dependent oxidoreductase n=1 Tax=Synechococcus sp. W55.1 TaxID=2964512 RepID=UPI0039C2228E